MPRIPLNQATSDGEQLKRLQLAMFQSAQTIIKRHGPGLPVDVLETYMKQLGGDLIILSSASTEDDKFKPFRVRITALAGRVCNVVGWG